MIVLKVVTWMAAVAFLRSASRKWSHARIQKSAEASRAWCL